MPSLFIGGQWVASADSTCSPVVNPSDASVITEVDVATDAQVHAAIGAARRAFDTTDWPRRPAAERAGLLDRVAGLIDRDLEALARLETLDTTQAKIVELRFFGGLTIEETAAALGTSPATVKREWAIAKSWLHRELTLGDTH
jgi:betaine-aldehyde dehydrogenase